MPKSSLILPRGRTSLAVLQRVHIRYHPAIALTH